MQDIKLNSTLKCALIAFFAFFSVSAAFSQSASGVKEIKIGDTIPPFILSGILNKAGKTINISNLYTKGLLIIDFGATWCVPCIGELHKLDTLVRKFPQQLSVISVDYEHAETVLKLLERHPELKDIAVPIITGDTLLVKCFPHRSLPHNIWIDKSGVVRAITGADEVNEKNVVSYISGANPHLLTKYDDINFNYLKPYHSADTDFIYRSIFSHYNPAINSGSVYDRVTYADKYMKRTFAFNCNVVQLFWLAAFPRLGYTSSEPYYPRLEVHTKDSVRFFPEKYQKVYRAHRDEWSKKNLFCYELILPDPVPDTLFCNYMLADLERNFNITAKIEKREQKCWVLTRNKDSSAYPRSSQTHQSFVIHGHHLSATGITMDDFLETIYMEWEMMPIVNETNLNYIIDIDIPFDKGLTSDIVLNYLKKCGFELKQQKRLLNKLVLYDNDK